MAGIEETLLKEPSALQDDDDDKRVDLPDEPKLSDLVREAQFVKAAPTNKNPSLRKQANTGPKGVLADYAEAREQARIEKMEKEAQYWDQMNVYYLTPQEKEFLLKKEQEENLRDEQDSDQNDDTDLTEEDLDLDDFTPSLFEKYKQQLLNNPSLNRKTFGYYRQINQNEFVEEVDNEDSSVPIIIHVFHPNIRLCQQMNHFLSTLSQKHVYCKMLRLSSEHASETFKTSPFLTLPTLLIYRNKELVGNFVRIVDDLENFDILTLEKFLISHKFLHPVASLVQ